MSIPDLLKEARQRYSDYVRQFKVLQACKGDCECFIRESFEMSRQYQAFETARQEYESALAGAAGAATPAPPPPSPNPNALENAIREIVQKELRAD